MPSSPSRRLSYDYACAVEMTVGFEGREAAEEEEEENGGRRIVHPTPLKNTQQRTSSADRSSRSSPASPISSSGPICRICHEGDVKEDLASPCRCAGSMQMVHRTCLEKWLSSSNSETCEICKYKFTIYRQPKSFSQWMKQQSHPDDYRNLMGDLLCFIVLTPLATISSYLCFIGAKHYAGWSTRWEASGLVSLSFLLLAIYFAWCIVTARYHHRVWSMWRIENQNVHLIQMRHISSPELETRSSPLGGGSGGGTFAAPLIEAIEMTDLSHSGTSSSTRRITTYLANRSRFGNSSQSLPFIVVEQLANDEIADT